MNFTVDCRSMWKHLSFTSQVRLHAYLVVSWVFSPGCCFFREIGDIGSFQILVVFTNVCRKSYMTCLSRLYDYFYEFQIHKILQYKLGLTDWAHQTQTVSCMYTLWFFESGDSALENVSTSGSLFFWTYLHTMVIPLTCSTFYFIVFLTLDEHKPL